MTGANSREPEQRANSATQRQAQTAAGHAGPGEPAEPTVRRRGNRRAGSPGPAGLLPEKAKEDDPRVWGDGPDDRDSWLLEQRPPHWG